MAFQDSLDGDVVIVAMSGKIMSCEDVSPLRAKVKDYLDRGKKNFVIDMADVPWMNSEGIGLLAATLTSIKGGGGRLVLANMNEKVEQVLTITKCNTIIDCFESRKAAIESFF